LSAQQGTELELLAKSGNDNHQSEIFTLDAERKIREPNEKN
jgi:hypothetical protein